MGTWRKKSPTQKGMALFITLVSLALMSVIVFGIVSLSSSYSRSVTALEDSYRAYYLAKVGILRALDNLENISYNWGNTTEFPQGVTYTTSEGTYNIKVDQVLDNATWSTRWRITSTSECNGATRILTAYAELETFARFAYFTDREKMSSGSVIWFMSKDRLSGKVHTNGYFSIYGKPTFTEAVTSANQTDTYYNSTTKRYTQGGKTYLDPAMFYHYNSGYTSDTFIGESNFYFAGGQDQILLPTDTSEVKEKATRRYTGDISITYKSSGQTEVTFYSSALKKNVTESFLTQGTTVHATGNVNLQGGTVVGKTTLGCDKNIYIHNDVLYADKSRDILGMVATDNVVVKNNTANQSNCNIHAIVMAVNGSFYVENYDSGSPRGTLSLYGGLIQNTRGPVGTGNGTSTLTGYNKDYVYDSKLKIMSPPNYPTTGRLLLMCIRDANAIED